ncbi:MAG: tetratricopeptide repeat protein [Acidobacteriota bacterium]
MHMRASTGSSGRFWIAGLVTIAVCMGLVGCAPRRPAPPVGIYLEDPLLAENLDAMRNRDVLDDFLEAWRDVQTGRLDVARRDFEKIGRKPDWERPARVALAYVALASHDRSQAASVFREVLDENPSNVPALLGLAQVMDAEGRVHEAYDLYSKVLVVSPSHAFAQLRCDITRLQATDLYVRRANEAATQNKPKQAIELLEKALSLAPDRAPLYLQLGDLYLRLDDYPHAISNLQQAVDRAPQDNAVRARLAEALFMNDNLEQAQGVYKELVQLDPKNSVYAERLRMVQDAIKWKKVPQQFKEIPAARVLTREALAALIALKVPEAVQKQDAPTEIAIDIGGWSREYVLQVIQAGLMDVYPGHQFAPREAVKRGEAALVASRVITSLRLRYEGLRSSTYTFTVNDVGRAHVYYGPVQTCLLYGLFQLDAHGDFNPAYTMSGLEGVRLVDSLAHLIGR